LDSTAKIYKHKKQYLTLPYNILEPASRLVNGIGQFFQLKQFHLIQLHSFIHEQKF